MNKPTKGKRGRPASDRTRPLYARIKEENSAWFIAKIARDKKHGVQTSMSKWLDEHFDELRKKDRKSA